MTGPGTPGGPGGPGCPTPSLPGSPCKRRPRPACRLRAGAELCTGCEEAPGAPPRPESPTTSGSSPHVSEAPRVAPGSRPHTLSPTHFLPRGPLFSFWSLQRQEGKASSQAEHKPLPGDLRRAWQPQETHRQPGPRVLPRRTESRVRGPTETWVPPPDRPGQPPTWAPAAPSLPGRPGNPGGPSVPAPPCQGHTDRPVGQAQSSEPVSGGDGLGCCGAHQAPRGTWGRGQNGARVAAGSCGSHGLRCGAWGSRSQDSGKPRGALGAGGS